MVQACKAKHTNKINKGQDRTNEKNHPEEGDAGQEHKTTKQINALTIK